MQNTQSNYNSSMRQPTKRRHRPPKNQHNQHRREKTPKTTHGDSTTVHWRAGTTQGDNSRQDTSVNLDISPNRKLAKTQTAVSTVMGQSQVHTCCCPTPHCQYAQSQVALGATQADLARANEAADARQGQHKRGFSRTGGFGK